MYAGMCTSVSEMLMHVLQVYAVTVYVEGEKAARELGVRQRGGFFDDNRCVKLAAYQTGESCAHQCMLSLLWSIQPMPGHSLVLWHCA